MNGRLVTRYVWTVTALAAVAAVLSDWTAVSALTLSDGAGLLGLIAVGMLSEAMSVGLGAGSSTSSIVFLPLLASVQLFGPAAGLILIAVTQSFGEFVARRKSLMRGTFNVSQMVLATALGGGAFLLLGGTPLEVVGNEGTSISSQLWPFVAFGLIVLAVNHAA